MPKKTHKLGELGDVDAVLKSSQNLSDAAKKLGVARSSLHRWLNAGKVGKAREKKSDSERVAGVGEVPDWASKWARGVLEDYSLSPTEVETLRMADEAREIAYSKEASILERMRGQAEFSKRVKDLGLYAGRPDDKKKPDTSSAPKLTVVKRAAPASDPRLALMAVK